MILINWHDTYSSGVDSATSADYLWPSVWITLCPFIGFCPLWLLLFIHGRATQADRRRRLGVGRPQSQQNSRGVASSVRANLSDFFFFFYFSLVSFDNPSDRLAQGPWTVPWADGASEGVVQWLQRLLSNEPHQRLCVELADEPKLAHNLTTFACCTGQ